ncbi:MAG TPA: enoyl-CoA hydratase/isomerase family protein [Terriglobales bacterium]|jgi:enoyl-CoA hydratase/carnithine racemase|nr:enoyl-CoA hydratase/isomerase family protein [Terriglobales bacterium]
MLLTLEHGAVRELRLDRPPANALSPDLIAALTQAITEAPQDNVRALIISGAPGMFSAGLDVPLLLTLDRPAIAAAWRDLYALMRAVACSTIPIAAAITGHAPAGGTVIALFCDCRVMAEGDWKMGLNEVQVGLPLPPVILAALKRQIGPRQAERLAVGGLLLSPAEAADIGLVDELVPSECVAERAIEWCQRLLALPSEAMLSTRRQSRADLVALFDQDFEHELNQMLANWWSPGAQTVLRAMVERLGKKVKGTSL